MGSKNIKMSDINVSHQAIFEAMNENESEEVSNSELRRPESKEQLN